MLLIVNSTPYAPWQNLTSVFNQLGYTKILSKQLNEWKQDTPIEGILLDNQLEKAILSGDNLNSLKILESSIAKNLDILFFYEDPAYTLARALEHKADITVVMEEWFQISKYMIVFNKKNRIRCKLINLKNTFNNINGFAQLLCKNDLVNKIPEIDSPEPNKIYMWIAAQLLEKTQELAPVFQELEASAKQILGKKIA